ncbi:hypothetical protein H4Q26_010200 [Puccinia striiformis f. sp. tritici PST-130]|nr:hypothetical protein H4Q26_010200 [Puccinia striiformis f. sp. tritici PST-130]
MAMTAESRLLRLAQSFQGVQQLAQIAARHAMYQAVVYTACPKQCLTTHHGQNMSQFDDFHLKVNSIISAYALLSNQLQQRWADTIKYDILPISVIHNPYRIPCWPKSKVPSQTITSANPHSARLLTRGQPPTYHRSPTRERVLPLISTGDWRSIYRTHPPIIRDSPNLVLLPSKHLEQRFNDRSTGYQSPSPDEHCFPMTPEENQNLINHYLTLVKQQRADNPPPPPFVDPLTSDERLDGIIKTVLADQELKLDQQINFNRSLREYRANKRMEAIARRDSIYEFMIRLTSELIKDPRPTLHSQDFDAVYFKKKFDKLEKTLANDKSNPLHKVNLATFNIRFEDYKDALIKAQEIEVQATQTRDETIIPTTKVLKIEYKPTQVDKPTSPVPEVTGNVHLDKHLAKTSISDKPIDKKEKTTKRKVLPLNSPFGGSTTSSFTTEPYFEDLKPTENFSSPVLKKIARKPALPILSDSEDELDKGKSSNPNLEPLHPDPEKRAKQSRKSDQGPQNPEGTQQTPRILGDYPRTPLVGRKSSLQRDGERIRERGRDSGSGNHPDPHQKTGEDPRQVLEGDLERRQENNLGSSSTEPACPPETHPEQGNRELRERVEPLDRKEEGFPSSSQKQKEAEIRQEESSTSKRQQSPRSNSLELPPRPNTLEQQPQPKPREYEQKPKSLEQQQPTSSSLKQPREQQTSPRRERRSRGRSEMGESASSYCSTRSVLSPHQKVNPSQSFQSKALSSLSTINHNLTTLEANHDVNTSKLLRVVEKCYVKSAKTLSEISDQLSDPLPVQMGPLEKSLVYHLKKEIDKVSNLVKDIHGTSNPEGIESLTTQIKYLRDTVYNLQNKQKELVNSLPKQSNESISDIFASLRIEIKSLTDIASVLSQKPTPDISADIMEKLEQSEASILSNVKQDLITEVRVYVQKEVETLTTTVTTSFEGIMSQLRNMEQNSNDKFNHLQRDIVEIKKEIISVDNRVAKAESNRLTSPLSHSSPTPFKTVVETENKNSPSKDLPPHQTQSVKEDDDRGPRLTEKEVGKLLPPLSEWVSFSGEGEYDYIEFIQYFQYLHVEI